MSLASTLGITFFVAGIVKGVTGMGLPTVAMAVLGTLFSPPDAAALLIVPAFVTNIWQLLAAHALGSLVRRLWTMMLAIAVVTVAATAVLTNGDSAWTTSALGGALLLYAGCALLIRPPRLSTKLEPWLSPLIGAVTGLVTGCTGVFVIPAVPYLQALDLNKEELVQALGLSFTISTVALAAGMASHGAVRLDNLSASALAVVPSLAGMWLGQIIRKRVNPLVFRRFFLICLIAIGVELLVSPLL